MPGSSTALNGASPALGSAIRPRAGEAFVQAPKRGTRLGGSEPAPTRGIVIAWPEADKVREQSIKRGSARWIGTELRVTAVPFTVTFAR